MPTLQNWFKLVKLYLENNIDFKCKITLYTLRYIQSSRFQITDQWMVKIMTRKIHKIYDGILRIIIFAYLQEFLRFIGENREIEEVLKGDITKLNGSTKYWIFTANWRTEHNAILNFSFQRHILMIWKGFLTITLPWKWHSASERKRLSSIFQQAQKEHAKRISARQKSSVRKHSIWAISILKKNWSLFTSNSI